MSWNIVPLETYGDQVIHVTVTAQDEKHVQLILRLRYNTEGEFWHMDISNNKGEMLISHAPMLTGEPPAENILRQFNYLGIGSALILKLTDVTESDIPGIDDLGTDFVLVWGSGDYDV